MSLRRIYYEFTRYCLYWGAIHCFGVRYFGRQNIPSSGGVLMVSNHQSHFDPPLVGVGSPRMMAYLARKTLFDIPVLGPFMRSVNGIPIDRDGLGLGGIKESLRRLKQGEIVLIFPEGTRSRDGRIARFRAGFTTLAVRSRAAIVPAAIHGAFDAWPRWQRFPGRHAVHVGYGRPMLADELSRYDERSLVAEVERRVRLVHEQLRAHPRFARGGCGGHVSEPV